MTTPIIKTLSAGASVDISVTGKGVTILSSTAPFQMAVDGGPLFTARGFYDREVTFNRLTLSSAVDNNVVSLLVSTALIVDENAIILSMPPVVIASMPAVTIGSMPHVVVDSLPPVATVAETLYLADLVPDAALTALLGSLVCNIAIGDPTEGGQFMAWGTVTPGKTFSAGNGTWTTSLPPGVASATRRSLSVCVVDGDGADVRIQKNGIFVGGCAPSNPEIIAGSDDLLVLPPSSGFVGVGVRIQALYTAPVTYTLTP